NSASPTAGKTLTTSRPSAGFLRTISLTPVPTFIPPIRLGEAATVLLTLDRLHRTALRRRKDRRPAGRQSRQEHRLRLACRRVRRRRLPLRRWRLTHRPREDATLTTRCGWWALSRAPCRRDRRVRRRTPETKPRSAQNP